MKRQISLLILLFFVGMFPIFSMEVKAPVTTDTKDIVEHKPCFAAGQILVVYECTKTLCDTPVFYKLEVYDETLSTKDYEIWSYTECTGQISPLERGIKLTLRGLSKQVLLVDVTKVCSLKDQKRIVIETTFLSSVNSRDIFYGESENKAFFAYCAKSC